MSQTTAPSAAVYAAPPSHAMPSQHEAGINKRCHHVFLASLGEVVYAIRTKDGLIKIGHTGDLAARRRHYSTEPKDLLGLRVGTYADEQAIHASLRNHVARGREYYHPTPEVLAVVNDMRAALGLSQLAA